MRQPRGLRLTRLTRRARLVATTGPCVPGTKARADRPGRFYVPEPCLHRCCQQCRLDIGLAGGAGTDQSAEAEGRTVQLVTASASVEAATASASRRSTAAT